MIYSDAITNFFTKQPLNAGVEFTVSCNQGNVFNIIEGDCDASRPGIQVRTLVGGILQFNLTSKYEGDLDLSTTWIVNSGTAVTGNIILNIVPPLEKNVIFYNSVLSPGKGDKAELWYQLDSGSEVTLAMYNSNGIKVKFWDLGNMAAGWQKFEWDLTNNGHFVKSGVYYFILKTAQWTKQLPLVVVK